MTEISWLRVGVVAGGAFLVLLGSWTYFDTGPGTGYTGYTQGHRLTIAITLIVGVSAILLGLLGVTR